MTPATVALLCSHIASGYPAPNYDLHVVFWPERVHIVCAATEQRYGDMMLTFRGGQYRTILSAPAVRAILPGETDED